MRHSRTTLIALALTLLIIGAIVIARDADEPDEGLGEPGTIGAPVATTADPSGRPAPGGHHGVLYGRVTSPDGSTHEGRLRFGGDEEAFWDDYFGGYRAENPWVQYVPPELLTERETVELFGLEIMNRERRDEVRRPFLARFGDIASIEVVGGIIRVRLKSGTVVDLDRSNADDLADGIRIWDAERGRVDLTERAIRRIDFRGTERLAAPPVRLHGTVRSSAGDFTGAIRWDRRQAIGSDVLRGRTAGGVVTLRFDEIASVAPESDDSALVVTRDGRKIVLSDERDIGHANRGIVVADPRYGHVSVAWRAFEALQITPGDSGPAYGDFPPGRPLRGTVITRDGDRLSGRIVFDLDESETIDTLDAPSGGIDYTIPFGLIESIVLPDPSEPTRRQVTVTLHTGEAVVLEREGDLGPNNAGLLVFEGDRALPEYLPWIDAERIDFDAPEATYPSLSRD